MVRKALLRHSGAVTQSVKRALSMRLKRLQDASQERVMVNVSTVEKRVRKSGFSHVHTSEPKQEVPMLLYAFSYLNRELKLQNLTSTFRYGYN